MFKRLFGKKKPQEELEQIVKQKESGEHKIYPILKPGDWVGLKAGALRQTLIGTADDPSVVIGFGYDTPDNFVFLTQDDLEKMDGDEIVKEAFQNLEAYSTDFEPIESLDNKVLTSSGRDFSSERILSQKHMLKAHELLGGAKEMLVSIPRRTCMMIMEKGEDNELMQQFLKLHHYTWQDDSYGNAPIANMLFVVQDGNIVGTFNLDRS
jgi:hypothetical protein